MGPYHTHIGSRGSDSALARGPGRGVQTTSNRSRWPASRLKRARAAREDARWRTHGEGPKFEGPAWSTAQMLARKVRLVDAAHHVEQHRNRNSSAKATRGRCRPDGPAYVDHQEHAEIFKQSRWGHAGSNISPSSQGTGAAERRAKSTLEHAVGHRDRGKAGKQRTSAGREDAVGLVSSSAEVDTSAQERRSKM